MFTDYQSTTKKIKSGAYKVDKENKKLTMTGKKDQNAAAGLDITWKGDHLVLISNMLNHQKMGAMAIEYAPAK